MRLGVAVILCARVASKARRGGMRGRIELEPARVLPTYAHPLKGRSRKACLCCITPYVLKVALSASAYHPCTPAVFSVAVTCLLCRRSGTKFVWPRMVDGHTSTEPRGPCTVASGRLWPPGPTFLLSRLEVSMVRPSGSSLSISTCVLYTSTYAPTIPNARNSRYTGQRLSRGVDGAD